MRRKTIAGWMASPPNLGPACRGSAPTGREFAVRVGRLVVAWPRVVCEEIMRGKHWPRTLVVFALLCLPNLSRAAAPAATPDYNVENSCPTRDTFWNLVREKLAAAGVD